LICGISLICLRGDWGDDLDKLDVGDGAGSFLTFFNANRILLWS